MNQRQGDHQQQQLAAWQLYQQGSLTQGTGGGGGGGGDQQQHQPQGLPTLAGLGGIDFPQQQQQQQAPQQTIFHPHTQQVFHQPPQQQQQQQQPQPQNMNLNFAGGQGGGFPLNLNHHLQQQQQNYAQQMQQQPQPFFFGGLPPQQQPQPQQQNQLHQPPQQQQMQNQGNNNSNNSSILQQQLVQHHQQLQNQSQQLQQLTASVGGGGGRMEAGLGGSNNNNNNNAVDPYSELAAVAAAFARVNNKQVEDGDDEDDDDGDEDEDDDGLSLEDDSEDSHEEPVRHRRPTTKRTAATKAGATRAKRKRDPNKMTRRQQPPKTNITRTRYSNDFKMRVVSEVEQPGYGSLTDIAKHYGVAEQTVRDWVKNKDKIQQAVIRRGNLKANPVDYLKHVTQELLKFMDERSSSEQQQQQPLTARMIAAKGEEIKNKILTEDARNPFLSENERAYTKKFSASLSWGKKILRQYGKPRRQTQVPADLEDLPKEELVRLLRSVASEREILAAGGLSNNNNNNYSQDTNRKRYREPKQNEDTDASLVNVNNKPSHSSLLPYIPSPPRMKPPPTFKVEQVKARIAETASAMIKKKAHNWKNRPTTEVTEEISSLEAARELFKGYSEINKTARSYRWNLSGEQVVEWLDCPKYVHPVKFEGKVVCQIGQPAYVYAFAGYDSLLAKYEQGSGILTLKFKTFTAGTGNIPGCDEPVFLCNEHYI